MDWIHAPTTATGPLSLRTSSTIANVWTLRATVGTVVTDATNADLTDAELTIAEVEVSV